MTDGPLTTARPYGVPAIVDQLRQRPWMRVSNVTRGFRIHWRTAEKLLDLGFAEHPENRNGTGPDLTRIVAKDNS